MTWRINIDESKYSSAKKLAWEFVHPLKYTYILRCEYYEVKRVADFLQIAFSTQALNAAAKRLEL